MNKMHARKTCSGMMAAVVMFCAAPAVQAATYNFTIIGNILAGDELSPNAYNLTVGDTVTVTGTFTANLGTIGSETGSVYFSSSSGNTMTIDLNGTLLNQTHDSGYGSGIGPSLTFESGNLFDFDFQKPTDPAFNSSFRFFDDFNLMFGEWTSLNLTVVPAAVPVPAAVWLFGSGLLGLAGFARRHKIIKK